MKRLAWVLATGLLLGLVATPAHAASYRYWQYWRVAAGADSWAFAATGPATRPADGAVEGWRFGISGAAGDDRPRRAPADLFVAVCGGTPAPDGSKRVAVVIDYGVAADAPPGEAPPAGVVTGCAVIPTAANGYDALREVAQPRIEGGLVCGIDGYPTRNCGAVVAKPPPTPTSTASAKPTPRATASAPAAGPSAGAAGPVTQRADASGAAVPGAGNDGTFAPTAAAVNPDPDAGDASPPAAEGGADSNGDSDGVDVAGSPVDTDDIAADTAAGSLTTTLLGLLLIAGLVVGGLLARRRRT